MAEFDTHELAWCAGFFDGEGSSYSFIERTGKCNVVIAAQVGQKDSSQLLLCRFQRAIGGYGLIRSAGKSKPDFYCLRLRSFEQAQYTICLLWKWLGPIKKTQYKKAVKSYLSICFRPKTDKKSLRKREIYKYGSVSMMIKMKSYEAKMNSNPNYVFINPFAKKEAQHG